MDGWVSIYRKMQDKSWYRDSEYVHVWLHLILNANYSNKRVWVNGQEVEVKRGQLLTSRKAISDKTGVTQSKIYRILSRYESEHQIEQQKTNKYTIITIVNYEEYQKSEQQTEQQMNNKRTTDEQQMNTNNNDNNVNNDNKYKKKNKKEKFVKPTVEEVQNYIQEKNLKVNAEGFIDYYEANGWLVGKNHMKDWKATLRNWNRRQGGTDKPEWFDKKIEEEKATDEEMKKMEDLLNEYK